MILFERVRWGEVGLNYFVLVSSKCVNNSLFQILNSELDKRLKEEDNEGLNQLVAYHHQIDRMRHNIFSG